MKNYCKITALIFAVLLISCKTKQHLIQVPIKHFERKVTTLVPFFVPGDSVSLSALFECDSLNNVLLRDLAERKSKNMHTYFDFKNGKLNYNAKTQPDTVFVPSDTIYIEKEVPVIVQVEVIRMSKLQRIFFFIGIISTTAIAVWLFIKLKF